MIPRSRDMVSGRHEVSTTNKIAFTFFWIVVAAEVSVVEIIKPVQIKPMAR